MIKTRRHLYGTALLKAMVVLLVACVSVGTLAACSPKYLDNTALTPTHAPQPNAEYLEKTFIKDTYPELEGFEKVGENGLLVLYIDSKNIQIAVKDKRTGHVWTNAYIPGSETKLNPTWEANTKSLFIVNAADIALNTNISTAYPSYKYNNNAKVKKLDKGVEVTYFFKEINLELAIDITLDNYGLVFSIPSSKIIEGKGLKEKFENDKNNIFRMLEDAERELDKLSEGSTASLFNDDIRRIRRIFEKHRSVIEPLQTAKSVEYLSIRAREILKEAINIVNGDVKVKGFAVRIAADNNTDQATRSRVAAVASSVASKIKRAIAATEGLARMKYGGIVSIDVMPFIGAGGDNDSGFVLYPDGCGAISYFKKEHPEYSSALSKSIYSETTINLDLEKERGRSGLQTIMLPVYGIHLNGSGFVAIASKGEADAEYNFYPSGFQANINRSFFSFIYRRQVKASDTRSSVDEKIRSVIEPDANLRDCEVRYIFLDDRDSSYSGMATATRNYLLSTGLMVRSKKLASAPQLSIGLLMGVKEKGLFHDPMVNMTTFEEAREMLAWLKERGVDNLVATVFGWTEEGYLRYPSGYKPSSSLGGRDLKELVSFATSQGYKLYLVDNYVDAYQKAGRYNGDELARYYNTTQISNYSNTEFLLTPKSAVARFKKLALPELSKYHLSGVGFDKIGSFTYYDYKKDNRAARQDSVAAWENMLLASVEQFGGAAVGRGSLYSLRYVDWLYEIPSRDTGLLFTDETVPFYQMVVHGSIPYASDPMNLFYDKSIEMLKAIEFGATPNFLLTKQDVLKLKYTPCNTMFSSQFDDYKEDAVAVYTEWKTQFDGIADKFIVLHERISRDIVRVKYSNNTLVLINYGKDDAVVDGVVVKATGYTVVKGGEEE